MELSQVALPSGSVYQLINGTASGDSDDHSYLRVEVAAGKVTVTAIHKTKDGPVAKESVTWTK